MALILRKEKGIRQAQGARAGLSDRRRTGWSGMTIAGLVIAALFARATPGWAFEAEKVLALSEGTIHELETAHAYAEQDGLAVRNAARTHFDSTPPSPGVCQAALHANALPIQVAYRDAGDGDCGSGLRQVSLWIRQGEEGVWRDTGLKQTGTTGSFACDALLGEGVYFFAARAEDKAGNVSSLASEATAARVSYDATPPEITLLGPPDMKVDQGAVYRDPGATAWDAVDGDLTEQIVAIIPVKTSVPGEYFVTYNVSDAASNRAEEVRRRVLVAETFRLIVNAPAHGDILASPAPGPGSRYLAGTEVALSYSPADGYRVTHWTGATPDPADPDKASVTMDADHTVSVTLGRETGTVHVEVTPDEATWSLTESDGRIHKGEGDATLNAISDGLVTIVYDALPGYITPPEESYSLAAEAAVTFTGVYEREESGRAIVWLPTDLTGKPGTTVDCSVRVNGAASLSSYAARVGFDGDLIEAVQVKSGALASNWAVPAVSAAHGEVHFTASGPSVAGDGEIAVLVLKIKDTVTQPAVVPLEVMTAMLNEGDQPVDTRGGKLTIQIGEFVWGDVDGDGQSTITDASLVLNYRVGLVESLPAADASAGESGIAGADVSGDDPSFVGTLDASLIMQKTAGLITTYPADFNGDGFGPDPESDAGSAFARALVAQLSEATTRELSVLGEIEATPGSRFSVPLVLDNAAAVLGYFVELHYDSSMLEFVSVNKGSLTGQWMDPVLLSEPGRLLVSGAGVKPLSGRGSLAVVRFQTPESVPAGAITGVSVALADLNDGAIPVVTRLVTVDPILMSITPDKGAEEGGSLVTVTGANLAYVDGVYFGSVPAPWFRIDTMESTLTIIAPAGGGVVDVRATTSRGGNAALPEAFTYFKPDVHLIMDPAPEVRSGAVLETPVWISHAAEVQPVAVSFTLEYDPMAFAAAVSGDLEELAAPAEVAVSAGKTARAAVSRPGRLCVSIDGSDAPLEEGWLCVCRLRAIGAQDNIEVLLHLDDVEVTAGAGKALSAATGLMKYSHR
jgi:hypothetical protein